MRYQPCIPQGSHNLYVCRSKGIYLTERNLFGCIFWRSINRICSAVRIALVFGFGQTHNAAITFVIFFSTRSFFKLDHNTMSALVPFAFLGLVEASNLAKRYKTQGALATTFTTYTLSSLSTTTTIVEAIATSYPTYNADYKVVKPHVKEVVCIFILLLVFISIIYFGCRYCRGRKLRTGNTPKRLQFLGERYPGSGASRTTQPNVTQTRTHSAWVS
jgi:hypothetical protein